ncbi:MAG: DNA polymerase III subunit gamma/tau [Gammaproteobacteria bacterium]
MNAAPPPFLSLARKWRPQTFSELVGHEYAARVLQNAARESRMHHAFLFTGTRGVGKTTLARIVAKMVNCPHAEDGAPCLKCDMCEQIAAGRMLDVVELDAASHTKVEEMRSLLEGANYPPSQGKCKVFVIDEAHMLSKSAFAAMLKTLEEPPGYLKFVLATTDPQKLPPTILSRCLCFALRPLERGQIAARLGEILRAEKREFDEAAVQTVARLARGSMRDALSILEQAIAHNDGKLEADSVRRITGDLDYGLLAEILRAVAAADAAALADFARRLQNEGAGFDAALARLAALLYKIALFRVAPAAAAESDEEREVIESAAPLFGGEEVQVLYEIAVRGRRQLPYAPDEQTGFEMTLLRMMYFAPRAAGTDSPNASAGAATAKTSPAAAVSADSGGGEAAWRRAISKLSGTARALAEVCVMGEFSADGVVLRADKSQKHSGRLMLPELEKQLRKIFHPGFRVTLADGEDDSAAAARARELSEAAAQTPFVRDVLAAIPEAEVRNGVQIYRQDGETP